MALVPNSQPEPEAVSVFVRLPAVSSRLTISRCMMCGLIVAASSDRRILQVAEETHHCPVYLNYMPPKSH